MGRRPGRKSIAPLLILSLIFSVSAAAPSSSQRAAQDVRAAADRGQWLRTEQLANEALRRFGTTDADSTWEIRVRRAEALLSLGKVAEARDALQSDLPKRLQRGALAIRRLLLRSGMEPDAANRQRLFNSARELASANVPAMVPEVMLFEAIVFQRNADVPTLREALRLAKRSRNPFLELRIEQLISDTLVHGGHNVEVIRRIEPLIARAHALEHTVAEQRLEGDYGWALYNIGDFEQASQHFERAEQLSRDTGAVRDRIPWLVQLGNVAYARRDLAAAERHYRLAYSLGEPLQHRQLGLIAANLSTITLETGRLDEARRLNAIAIAIKQKNKQTDALLRSRIVESRIDVAARDYEAARKVVESVAAETKVLETRWLAEAQLAAVYAAEDRKDDADQQFRRALATLREARKAIDDEPLRLSFNTEAGDVISDYVDFLVKSRRAEDALRAIEVVQGETLEEALGVKTLRDPRTIAKQVNSTILCYHLGEAQSYVWTISPDAITVASLPPRGVIHAAIDAYVRDLLGPVGTNNTQGIALYRMLVEPAGVRGGRVIVIPDERLNVLNFEALVVPTPRPHYWIEDVVLSNAPSLQLLGREVANGKRANSLLLIGNAPQADPAYPALPKAAAEVDAVRKQFSNVSLLTGLKATPAAYRDASPQNFDVVHFVAHGEATIANPFESAVILGRDANGYKLFAKDIIRQPITARLVTISSCYGAGKRTYVGEGLVGLAWAFLRAGAQQVIAAVWDVDDTATPKLMNELYANIRTGRDPATALHNAKLSLVRSNGVHGKPRFWAPFVIYSGM